MTKCAQVITSSVDVDFIDVNCGCPIDLIFKKVRCLLFSISSLSREGILRVQWFEGSSTVFQTST